MNQDDYCREVFICPCPKDVADIGLHFTIDKGSGSYQLKAYCDTCFETFSKFSYN